ncbi:hypothetical protein VTO42DRAFT_7629 [Malbranchea cinnamomea]
MAVVSALQTLVKSPADLLAASLATVVTYAISRIVYNVFFHPLRSFPGPILHAASRIPYCHKLIRGTLPFDVLAMHKKYGDVVRVAPNELAISTPQAWKDIMGPRDEVGKYMNFYRPTDRNVVNIVSASREEHSLLRRQLSHGFSEKSMREQESLIGAYIDLLIKRLHELSSGGRNAVDLVAWYNYTTFDVIGDLAFGEPFGCLEDGKYHPFVKTIIESARLGTILQSLAFYPLIKKILLGLVPKSVMERQQKMARDKLVRRMESSKERPDLIEGLLKKKDEWNMSLEELESNSTIILIGGSETTATLLSGVTFFLLTNPAVLEKLTTEVRSAFKAEEEITLTSVAKLTYMLACLDEALRIYPPVPIGLPRVVPKGGRVIAGRFVPENTIVAIHQWATYHNDKHFSEPFGFHPERFIAEDRDRNSRFADDKFEALQPFHVGPRNCIGRNLAYAEMRLILARIIYNFDMRIADESRDWLSRQKIYLMWEKGPMKVYLTPVSRK